MFGCGVLKFQEGFRALVFCLGWKVFLFGLGFGVERYRFGLKVLGFGGGFFWSGALIFG